jgi:hypothetical protein
MAELANGLSRNNIRSFYVEAVVSVDNEPSKRVALSTISSTPTEITGEVNLVPSPQPRRPHAMLPKNPIPSWRGRQWTMNPR